MDKNDISIIPIKKRKISETNNFEINEQEKFPIINREENDENKNKTLNIPNTPTKLRINNFSYNNKRTIQKYLLKT